MGNEHEVIEHDIDQARGDLSRNLDALTDRVSPGRVVDRKVGAVKSRFGAARDAVMGSASSASGATTSTVENAGDTLTSQARGNPLAAGLIAFGAGWLASSLVPASEAESRLADRAVESAKDLGEPVVDQAKSVAGDVGADLKDKAAQSVSELKDSATESAQHVKDDTQAAAQGVRDDVS